MRGAILLLAVLFAGCAGAPPEAEGLPPVATFSIVAYDAETGDLGVAVQSKFFGVGSVVPFARADVGAVATQAWANTTYGPEGLDLLEEGLSAEKAVSVLTKKDGGRERRQLGIVDAKGRAAAFTGKSALAWAGHLVGEGFSCQGNILAGEKVVKAMAEAYRKAESPLPERLVAALRAGQAAGGDKRGRQSAALLVVRRSGGYSGFNDRYVDVRVEDHETPIEELSRLLALHRRFFPNVPVPREREGFLMEPEPTGGPLATPRAAYETWVKLFRARDLKALYLTHTKTYRSEHPYEAWVKETESSAAGIESLLEQARYAGTRMTGDKARVALDSSGSPRPILLSLEKEEGEWRFAD